MPENGKRRRASAISLRIALSVVAVILVAGLLLAFGTADHRALPDRDVAVGSPPVEKPETEEGYERITDEEFARRAAESPDQARVGRRFDSLAAASSRTAPGGLAWQPLGPRPFSQEYWSGDSDASGRVCALLVDPRDADVVYAAGAQGGVWKTVDAGLTWTPLTDGLSSLASGALAFDPVDPDILYYGTGEQHFSGDSFYGDGLFRTQDAGLTWTKIAAKADVGSYIARVAVAPDQRDILYVAGDRGFVTSLDGGATWSVDLGPGDCTDIAVDPVTPGVVYCAFRYSGVWKSDDYAETWTKLGGGLPTTGFRRINIAQAPSAPQTLYAAFAANDGTLFGMYKTTDAGATWTELTGTPEYLGGQGNYDNCITVDPADADVCYAGGTFPFGGAGDHGLIRTADGGATWTDINVGVDGSQPHPDHHIFAWGGDGRLWLGNDGGVWSTADGGLHWTNHNATLSLGQLYTCVLHPTSPSTMLGGTQDNGSARYDGVDAWPQVIAGDGGPSAIEWDSPNIYYTSYVQLRSLYKFDNGVYQGLVTGPWDGERASWCNAPLVVDPNQPNTLLAGTHRVWRTTNSGASWTALSGDLTNGGHLRAVAVAEGDPDVIYAGSSDGLVHVTQDAAAWQPRSAGLPAEEIPDIAVDPLDWHWAYLCCDRATGGRVYATDDAGVSWVDITGDLPDGLRAMCLAVDFRPEVPRLYLGTDYGVYASIDDGLTWVKASQDLPNLAVYDLAVDTANDLLVAGTHGRGAWRSNLDVTEPAIALTSPTGGESWNVDGIVDITWTAADAGGIADVALHLSRDGGATYPELLGEGLPNTGSFSWMVTAPESGACRVRLTVTDESANTAVAASAGDFSITHPTGINEDLPATTALLGAYPNPFNPSTTIRFALAADADARLRIYGVDGELVATLIDRPLGRGLHEVVWNGQDDGGRACASGSYLYRLETSAGFVGTGKVSLMK